FLLLPPPPISTLFPYTTLFRSTGMQLIGFNGLTATSPPGKYAGVNLVYTFTSGQVTVSPVLVHLPRIDNQETFLVQQNAPVDQRSEEHTSELQSRFDLVCRLLL